MVCLGNICRSPTAEAALREALAAEGLDGEVEVDSAGTGDWHIGRPPDSRMTAAAAGDGLTLVGTARRVGVEDFALFDLILAMDESNAYDLRRLAPTVEAQSKVRLFREFEPDAAAVDVPDPYYGEAEGFAEVVRITRAAAAGLVRWLRSEGLIRRADADASRAIERSRGEPG